jgi:hypothetical protein
MSKHNVSHSNSNVNSDTRPSSSLLSRVVSANANPLMRVEQIKKKFVSAQLAALRTSIYATMRQGGASHAYALAEVDRAFREVAGSVANASKLATNAAAQADHERSSS